MSRWSFRDHADEIRFRWLLIGIVLVSVLFAGLFAAARGNRACFDMVPDDSGRCWGERDLVVEQGAVLCRCRR